MDDLLFVAPPRISATRFARILQDARSPAAGEATTLYAVPARYGIDPGIALAFFRKESSCGTAGVNVSHEIRNWGNLRRAQLPGRGVVVSTPRGQFVRYATWAEGLDDWCRLIRSRYVDRGLDTVRRALPVYAPVSDGNDPDGYARQIVSWVQAWAALPTPADPWVLWGTRFPLEESQRGWEIPKLWLENARWLGAATSMELYVDPRPGLAVSMQTFEGGWIVYEQATNIAQVYRRGGGR